MREIYEERQRILVEEVRKNLKGRLEVAPAEAGMHPADPRLAIAWPLPADHLSPRDAGQPLLTEEFEGVRL